MVEGRPRDELRIRAELREATDYEETETIDEWIHDAGGPTEVGVRVYRATIRILGKTVSHARVSVIAQHGGGVSDVAISGALDEPE